MKYLYVLLFLLAPIINLIVWLSAATLIIVRYGDIGYIYESRLNAGYLEHDPLESFTLEDRRRICDQIIKAKMFINLPLMKKVPPETTNPAVDVVIENFQRFAESYEYELQDPAILHYAALPLNISPTRRVTINAFPCVRTPAISWYVTFGWKKDEMFLIEDMRNRNAPTLLTLTGIIETTSQLADEYSILLLQRITKQIQCKGPWPPKKVPRSMKLNLIGIFERVRLCSSVFEVITKPENGYFQQYVRKLNYVRILPHRHEKKYFRIGVYPRTAAIKIDVLACSINREPFQFQFYILGDPQERGAAYVLVNSTWRREEILLMGKVRNIQVLLNKNNEAPEVF